MTSVTEPPVDKAIDIHTTAGKLEDLSRRTEETLHPVGEAAVEKVHQKGKLTARERILALLDEGSFVELDALAKHRSTNFGLADKHPLFSPPLAHVPHRQRRRSDACPQRRGGTAELPQ